jgi:hypothetical protein
MAYTGTAVTDPNYPAFMLRNPYSLQDENRALLSLPNESDYFNTKLNPSGKKVTDTDRSPSKNTAIKTQPIY